MKTLPYFNKEVLFKQDGALELEWGCKGQKDDTKICCKFSLVKNRVMVGVDTPFYHHPCHFISCWKWTLTNWKTSSKAFKSFNISKPFVTTMVDGKVKVDINGRDFQRQWKKLRLRRWHFIDFRRMFDILRITFDAFSSMMRVYRTLYGWKIFNKD